MSVAAVAELKARLSEYLREVKAGHDVIVTDRGRPVARIVPISASEGGDERREALVAAGMLRPGRGRVRKSLLSFPRGLDQVDGIVDALLEEREEGR